MSTKRRVFKMVLLGQGSVGKTSLRRRYLGEGFKHNYTMTMGADIALKRITKDDIQYLIQIWDLGGQSGFQTIRAGYYESALAGLLVFDISKPATFNVLNTWIHEIEKNRGKSLPLILVGNKSDLRDQNGGNFVSEEEARAYAKSLSEQIGTQVEYIETSALEGTNVDKAFDTIIDYVSKFMDEQEEKLRKLKEERRAARKNRFRY